MNNLHSEEAEAKKNFAVQIGKLIQEARYLKRVDQTTLAKRINRSAVYLCDMERGKKPISSYMLHRIATALDTQIDIFCIKLKEEHNE